MIIYPYNVSYLRRVPSARASFVYLFIRAVSRFSPTTNYFANRSLVFEKPCRILCRRAGSLQRVLGTGKERRVVHAYWSKQL